MANLGKVVYLSEAQKETLFANGSVTVNGTTVTYNQNDLYVTPTMITDTCAENSNALITSGGVYNAILSPYISDLSSVYPESMKARFRSNIGTYSIVIEEKSLSNQSINSGKAVAFEIDVAKTGYTPVGIAGFGLEYPSDAEVYYASLVSSTVACLKARNNAGSSVTGLKVFVNVIYVKNDT